MPHTETVLRVFVGSPMDVADERAQLEEIVRELNLVWSRDLGIRLDLIRWETHSVPGVGVDAQAVINENLSDDYDIFIGILWARFGSPTLRAESGTAEEFHRAYSRHQQDSSRVNIMFYFKDAPLAPSQIDPEQLGKVIAFRKQLGSLGVLYWNFTDRDSFGSYLRVHLARTIQSWKQKLDTPPRSASPVESQASLDNGDDDTGFLELIEESEEGIQRMSTTLLRMGEDLQQLTAKMNRRTAEFRGPSGVPIEMDRAEIKRLSKQAAEDMLFYARQSEADLPLYAEASRKIFDRLARAAALVPDFGPEQIAELRNTLRSVRDMRAQASDAEQAIAGFRESIARLPRLSTDINKAKRRTVAAVNAIVEEMKNTQGLAGEVEKIIRDILDEHGD